MDALCSPEDYSCDALCSLEDEADLAGQDAAISFRL